MAAAAALGELSGGAFLLPAVVCSPRNSVVPADNSTSFDPNIAMAAATPAMSFCVRFMTFLPDRCIGTP